MDSINSFKGYGKVDPIEEQAFRRKTRRRVIILIVSIIILVAVIIGAVAGTLIHKRNGNSSDQQPSSQTSPLNLLTSICTQTTHPNSCLSSISSLKSYHNVTHPEDIFKLSLQVVQSSISTLSSLPRAMKNRTNDERVKLALDVCEIVFDDALDNVSELISVMEVKSGEKVLTKGKIDDFKTWLSSSITDQETCLDALSELNGTSVVEDLKVLMKNSSEYASNSLAIVVKVIGVLVDFDFPIHRKLLAEAAMSNSNDRPSHSGFPYWVKAGDRRLLQEVKPTANVTVAKDGSGDCLTLKEAMAKVPKKSVERFVIYVKAGEYVENVVLDKSFWNVMVYGDGKKETIISGSLNFVDGTPTFSTATFAVQGRGFIAKNMAFRNTAGAVKHQAVAFRSGSDRSVFFGCSFEAFQDTLYAHSNRQFYRDCDITGTIDFIFGNAAVVFQNCNIMPRQPLANQFVTITAQGKKDPNQNTGISIQKCSFYPLDNLTAPTYLGRPWKEYSTTVIMQSDIGPFLNPKGWTEWVSNVDPPASIFYAEYQNTGVGAGVANRVTWAGYKPSITMAVASKYTVQSFLEGSDWLPAANVLFDSTL